MHAQTIQSFKAPVHEMQYKIALIDQGTYCQETHVAPIRQMQVSPLEKRKCHALPHIFDIQPKACHSIQPYRRPASLPHLPKPRSTLFPAFPSCWLGLLVCVLSSAPANALCFLGAAPGFMRLSQPLTNSPTVSCTQTHMLDKRVFLDFCFHLLVLWFLLYCAAFAFINARHFLFLFQTPVPFWLNIFFPAQDGGWGYPDAQPHLTLLFFSKLDNFPVSFSCLW